MSWNHRVIRRVDNGVEWYSIYEVFYDAKGRIWGCTETPVTPYGESLEELRADVLMFAGAVAISEDEVLDYDSIPEEGAIGPRERAALYDLG